MNSKFSDLVLKSLFKQLNYTQWAISFVTLMSPLLVCISNEFLVCNQTLAFAHVFNQDLSWILRQNITDSMIFKLFFCNRNKEWIFFVDKEPVEHELWIRHALALQPDTLMELKRSD